MHKRQQVVDEITEQLNVIAELTVVSSRYYPIAKLPHCTVVVIRDDARHLQLDKTVEHDLTLDLEIIVEGYAGAEDDLSYMCEMVETRMTLDHTFGGIVRETRLTGTEIEYSGDGENRHAKATITYNIFYTTSFSNPSA